MRNPFQDVTDMVNGHRRRVGVVPDIVVLLVVNMVWLVLQLEMKRVSLERGFLRLSHMLQGQLSFSRFSSGFLCPETVSIPVLILLLWSSVSR